MDVEVVVVGVLLVLVGGLDVLCRDGVTLLGVGELVELELGLEVVGSGAASGFFPGDCGDRDADGLAEDAGGVS